MFLRTANSYAGILIRDAEEIPKQIPQAEPIHPRLWSILF